VELESMDKVISKDEIRHLALNKRDHMDEKDRRNKSESISIHVFEYIRNYSRDAQILSFIAFRSEPELRSLHNRLWEHGYRIAIPRVLRATKQLDWRMLYRYDDLQAGYAGIMEPSLELIPWVYDSTKPIVILMPGLAFDQQGGRLGYGGGYYDRFVAAYGWMQRGSAGVLKVAPAFFEQVIQVIPMEAHDVVVDVVITEFGPLI
jgi:5-formyltetrahydrofolate cyclo-ligase